MDAGVLPQSPNGQSYGRQRERQVSGDLSRKRSVKLFSTFLEMCRPWLKCCLCHLLHQRSAARVGETSVFQDVMRTGAIASWAKEIFDHLSDEQRSLIGSDHSELMEFVIASMLIAREQTNQAMKLAVQEVAPGLVLPTGREETGAFSEPSVQTAIDQFLMASSDSRKSMLTACHDSLNALDHSIADQVRRGVAAANIAPI